MNTTCPSGWIGPECGSRLVSVIIPTHNRPEMLRQALGSVLEQTFRDFEVIVVDDCSEPEARPVVEGFGDPRIVYLRNERRLGGGAAQNRAFKAAKGRYVAILGDDDVWLPTKLEKQMVFLRSVPAEVGVVYCGHYVVDCEIGTERAIAPEMRGDVRSYLWSGHCGSINSSVLIRKALLDEIGGYDETLPSYQDYDLWLRLAPLCSFEYVDEPLVKVRKHLGPRVSVGLSARLRGFEQFSAKWRDRAPPGSGIAHLFRHGRTTIYANAAEAAILAGDWPTALRRFATAFRMGPLTAKLVLQLVASLAGPAAYKTAFWVYKKCRSVAR